MARHEADREDLFAEVVALTRRLAGRVSETGPLIVAGYRENGWLSVYLGPDPMYQFDEFGRLRRAFRDGLLYRTQGTTLARLRRERTPATTELLRSDLTSSELGEFRRLVYSDLLPLATALQNGCFQDEASIPADDMLLAANIAATLRLSFSAEPWLAPPVAGRRR
ncbi:MAG: hypothetical protein SFV23_12415 [Planctomycetaceae bacterium]|nr:hypothetical protein [Planctomycetaceae bacterium]